jgi:hypothetical protein
MAMSMKTTAFWDIAPYSLAIIIALMMEAVCTSEKSVYFNKTAWHCIPKSCNLNHNICFLARI